MTQRLTAFLRGLDNPAARVCSPIAKQQPARYFEGLTAKPFHDPAAFPFTRKLERAFESIRDEALALQPDFISDPGHAPLIDGRWSRVEFYNFGHRYRFTRERCPRTAKIVDAIAGADAAGLVYFSRLGPGTKIRRHSGPANTRLRCHLPLIVPKGCALTVAGKRHAWVEGECVVFDDSFVHSAANPAKTARLVLIVDVWHPELTAAERKVLAPRFAAELGPKRRSPYGVSALNAFADLS